MKHVFVINPVAGGGKKTESAKKNITEICSNKNLPYEIYITCGIGDASRFAYEYDHGGEQTRFYACGGDGTLSEVINGLVRRDDREMFETAMVPIGSGNDFARNFDTCDIFENIEAQVDGEASPIDVITYSRDGKEIRSAVNIFNMGLDCAVVERATKFREKPYMIGAVSYTAGLVSAFRDMPHCDLDIETDNGSRFSGKYLLALIANGSYYGGGYKASPFSSLNDGKLDLVLVKNTTRRVLLGFVGKYRKGTIYKAKIAKKLLTYLPFEKAHIISPKEISICIDGEIMKAKELFIEIKKKCINFSRPKAVARG